MHLTNKHWLLSVLIPLLGACDYSPWETESDCSDRYEANLAWLEDVEKARPGQAFSVALLTDFHNDLDDLTTAVKRINQRDDVDFALILGDMTDQGLAAEFEWMCKAVADLKVPRFYVIGNHDSISFGKEIFTKYFAPFDYAFRYKDVKFILYNDNAFEFPGAPDEEFLAAEAAWGPDEVTRRMTIGVSHIPPVMDVHTEQEAYDLRAFLSANGFDLTLHGHHHQFYYWRDEFDRPHYIDSRVREGKYGMLFITDSDGYLLQNCEAECTDAQLGVR